MLWEKISGQDEAISYLQRAVENDALSHAYLFAGPSGVGKFTTAQVLAAVLNCESYEGKGCGGCSSCLKIGRQVHPDIFLLEPQGNFITIDQIRELQSQVLLKPLEGKVKICILDQAERLTPPAANALLRILEEPPPYLLFILVAQNLETVLPTIVSRCQLIRFRAIHQAYLENFLVENHSLREEEARLITRITGGVFGQALKWVHFPEKFLKRERVLKILQELAHFDLLRLLTEVENLILEVNNSLDKIRSRQKEELAKEEKLASDPPSVRRHFQERYRREIYREELQSFQEILSIIRSWYRDLLVLTQTHLESLLINLDKLSGLKEISQKTDSAKLQEALEVVENTHELLKLNLNKSLVMERMFLKLKEMS